MHINESGMTTSLRFYGAADHFFEFEIPDSFPQSLKLRMKALVSYVMERRFEGNMTVTQADWEWALTECKAILRLIDKQLKVKSERGDYE
jgi:hypothetical protein